MLEEPVGVPGGTHMFISPAVSSIGSVIWCILIVMAVCGLNKKD